MFDILLQSMFSFEFAIFWIVVAVCCTYSVGIIVEWSFDAWDAYKERNSTNKTH